MSLHRKKITLRVSAQTAYNIKALAKECEISEGQFIDVAVTAWKIGHNTEKNRRNLSRETTKNEP